MSAGKDETGWLIETKTPEGVPCYWGGPALWTTDHLKAIRFARKLDGERVAEDLDVDRLVVVEHIWCAPPETCDGCNEPATRRDMEGVPFCQACYDDAFEREPYEP